MRKKEEKVDFLQIALLLKKWEEHYTWVGLFLDDISNIDRNSLSPGNRIAPTTFVVKSQGQVEGSCFLMEMQCVGRNVAYFRLLPKDFEVPEKGWMRLRFLDRNPNLLTGANVSKNVCALLFAQKFDGEENYNYCFPVTYSPTSCAWKSPSSDKTLISFIQKSLHPDYILGM